MGKHYRPLRYEGITELADKLDVWECSGNFHRPNCALARKTP